MNRRKNRLKEVRESAGLSQAEMAKIAGISTNTYQRYEYGERDIPGDVLINLIKHFGVSGDYILEQSNSPKINSAYVKMPRRSGTATVPIYGEIAAGTPIDMMPIDQTYPVPEAIAEKYPDAFLLRVDGDSMNRILPNGCFAFVDPCKEVLCNGAPYAVCVNGYAATIKRVRRLNNGFELVPDSTDPTYKPKVYDYGEDGTETVTVIGRVVWYCVPTDWEF